MKYNIVLLKKEAISAIDLEYISHQVLFLIGKKPETFLILDQKRYEEFVTSEDQSDFIVVDNLFSDQEDWGDKHVKEIRGRFPQAQVGCFPSRLCDENLYDFVIHAHLYDDDMKNLSKKIAEKVKPE